MKHSGNDMNTLPAITIQSIGGDPVQGVDARELHRYLQSRQDFSTWVKSRIKEYEFSEGTDFVSFHKKMERATGGTTRREYAITLDMAKELSMVERNEQGKKARRYFIRKEKEANSQTTPVSGQTTSTANGIVQANQGMLALAEQFGLTGNRKLISASQGTEALTGYSPMKLLGINGLESEKQEQRLRPTDIARRMGYRSAQIANNMLEQAGLQESVYINNRKMWVLTQEGAEYGVYVEKERLHATGIARAIEWHESVTQVLQAINRR